MTHLARASRITGWMSEPELLALAAFASFSLRILEVGSFQGRSTRALADNTLGVVHAVDPWDGKSQTFPGIVHYNGNNETHAMFCANLNDHLVTGKVVMHRMNFSEYGSSEKFDFIFLDALHDYDSVRNDIALASPLLADNGILAGHDYCDGWPGVKQAVDELFPNRRLVESIWYVTI